MEDLVEDLTRGNVTEVKVVLASVILALATYQVLLMIVGYGKVRVPFLSPESASTTHRTVGDSIVVLVVVVAFMCLAYFGFEDGGREVLHAIAGTLLVVVLALKIAVVRWWHSAGRFLPLLGMTVFVLLIVTWSTSAGHVLGGD